MSEHMISLTLSCDISPLGLLSTWWMAQYLQGSTWYVDKQWNDREADVGNKDRLPLLIFAIVPV